ncbi:MAG: UDP-N-acetylglucosamine 2-epimerase (non-hydrolyzing) [Acidobacteriia bacterium]|nr:UDP-N-acetylglucosamine 2-epimerase (non-hydrolyzing) [Terriglobia bacterium]
MFGTRPEAVKLCPVIKCMQQDSRSFSVRVCVTAQHRHLLDQVLEAFHVRPNYDLDLMSPGQTLYASTAGIVQGLEPVLASENPDMVVVQGDTTTTFCGALAAFYKKIPVAHVEAGLRTWDVLQPFPEEMNRLLTTRLASLHFAATDWAADNLRKEAVPDEAIFVTGNTGIDAVLHVAGQLEQGLLTAGPWPQLDPQKHLVLVTAHRRESFGEGMENLCTALERLARRPDVQIVYPVHPNPNVRETVYRRLSGQGNIILMEPLAYVPFVDLMRRSYLLLTDSGGVQEEGPSLGKPILVLREKTERPEAVLAGTVQLVGTDPERILTQAAALLDDPILHARMSAVHNPYGDGRASERISSLIASF